MIILRDLKGIVSKVAPICIDIDDYTRESIDIIDELQSMQLDVSEVWDLRDYFIEVCNKIKEVAMKHD